MKDQQFQRYQRQIMVPEISGSGQERLLGSKVLLIGCGGLGSAAALYLVGAGVQSLVVADGDEVETSNLQRQIIYRQSDVGVNKAQATATQLKALNPDCKVRSVQRFLEGEQLELEIMMADVILDCSDNFPTRQAVNRACHKAKKTLISGSAIGWTGQLMSFDFSQSASPCYRCVVANEDNQAGLKCSESGVIGPVVGMFGNLQAIEAIKYITQNGQFKPAKLHLFDGQSLSWQQFNITKDETCPVCHRSN